MTSAYLVSCSRTGGKLTFIMAKTPEQVKKEQLRKRRENLLRRHNDFWRLYKIKSWLTMETEDGRIIEYYSHPGRPIPTYQNVVSDFRDLRLLNNTEHLRKMEYYLLYIRHQKIMCQTTQRILALLIFPKSSFLPGVMQYGVHYLNSRSELNTKSSCGISYIAMRSTS